MTCWPVPDVVPAVILHTVNEGLRIRFVCQISLDGFVGSIGVTDEDLETPIDHRVDATLHLGRKPGNLSRTGDEDSG